MIMVIMKDKAKPMPHSLGGVMFFSPVLKAL